MPTVSVIVPNYNHARYLRKRIESVLGQTYQDFEMILLDDCSTDESRSIIGEYENDSRVRIEFNEKNSGSTFKQWNKGVRLARGRYVWIAESDDYADPRFLERMVPILEEQPEVTFAYCRSWRVGEDSGRLEFADACLNWLDAKHWTADFVVDGFEECRKYFAICNPVPNASAVLLRKEIYENVGWADEGLRVCGDYKVWAAMAFKGKFAYAAEPLNYFRTHSENVRTRNDAGMLNIAEYFYVMLWVLHHVAPPDTLVQKAVIGEILGRLPLELNPRARVEGAQRSLSFIVDWNRQHNRNVGRGALRVFFSTWELALVGREFAICPPSRWRFFLHRCRFYKLNAPGMRWTLKLVNLVRVLGAPIVGYRHRHWPEQAFERVISKVRAISKTVRT
jgi:glycosyltransferase involved in cell wall biosynthesis